MSIHHPDLYALDLTSRLEQNAESSNMNILHMVQGCISIPRIPWALKSTTPKQLLFYSNWIMLLLDGNLVSPYLVLDILGF